MEFWKGQALGNDYIVVDAAATDLPEPNVIRGLCDRRRGAGSDGVLYGSVGEGGPAPLRIFNPDGTEAEKSGNGLRIFGAWLDGRGAAEGVFPVALPGETVTMEVESRRSDGSLTLRVAMGRASFRAGDIPFTDADPEAEVMGQAVEVGDREMAVHLVSMGNPHCVVFLDELDMETFRRYAPILQSHPSFERGANVQFARVVGPSVLEARIWERGAGETLASGSSACAVASAARRTGRAESGTYEVRMEGGSVRVAIDDDWSVRLTGEAQMVYRGRVDDAVVEGWRRGSSGTDATD